MKQIVICLLLTVLTIQLSAQTATQQQLSHQKKSDIKSSKDSVFVPVIPYQGLLKDKNGNRFTDGQYDLVFNLYAAADAQKQVLWTEKQQIKLTDGVLSVYLGSVNPLKLTFNQQYSLQIIIDKEIIEAGTLGASAYSFMSGALANGAVNSINGISGNVEIKGDGNVLVSNDQKGGLKVSLNRGASSDTFQSNSKPDYWSFNEDIVSTSYEVQINNTLKSNRIEAGRSIVTPYLESDEIAGGKTKLTDLSVDDKTDLKNLDFGNIVNVGRESISSLKIGNDPVKPALTLSYNTPGTYFDFSGFGRSLNYHGTDHNFYGRVKIINDIMGPAPEYMLEVGGKLKITDLSTPPFSGRTPQFLATDGGAVFKTDLPAQKWQGTTDIYYNSGKVGIGTATPSASLTIAKAGQSTGGIMLTEDISGTGGTTGAKAEESKWSIKLATPNNSASTQGDDIFGLQIKRNGVSNFFLTKEGKLGIGTESPSDRLEVNGTIKAANFKGSGSELTGVVKSTNGQAFMLGDKWLSNDGGSEGIKIDNAGQVLVACQYSSGKAADAKLVVNGKIAAEKIVVITDVEGDTPPMVNGQPNSEAIRKSWPDYVFENNYQMMSLPETEQFIKANKHLPDVPSRAEVSADGVNLGEMQHILLKKVEELTLHLIELEKQNRALTEKLNGIGR